MSLNASAGWETVGGAGKPIKKTGSTKQVAKLEAEAKKKFAEKAPKLDEVRKSNSWFVCMAQLEYNGSQSILSLQTVISLWR